MAYLAEAEKPPEIVVAGRFTITKLVERTDAEDKVVQVKETVGTYTVADLESQKTALNNQIADIQAKIDAIKVLGT